MSAPLHSDFGQLRVTPGELHFTAPSELYDLVNVVAFGGAVDRPTHVPTELGTIGPVVFWESTGAADALPFWNTNFQCDVYLYLVHGSVRVEFKETEGDERYGHYIARTGDLFKLPKDIAHRTFSVDGKRRISLEILERNPHWATMGTAPTVADDSGVVGGFRFDVEGEDVRVTWPEGSLVTPRHFFARGLAALIAYELHLEHNEFEGGFIVHDLGERVTLKARGYSETLPPAQVLATFAGLMDRCR
ncbi:MAG: hypothetical protein H0V64_14060 [Geodermatophilaceae bacterium]|nr:hypothetical protein [Geodermatophilaceae bacterium]MDQ3463575.1 hypothetical protein [Actinomycetota bacterium]